MSARTMHAMTKGRLFTTRTMSPPTQRRRSVSEKVGSVSWPLGLAKPHQNGQSALLPRRHDRSYDRVERSKEPRSEPVTATVRAPDGVDIAYEVHGDVDAGPFT